MTWCLFEHRYKTAKPASGKWVHGTHAVQYKLPETHKNSICSLTLIFRHLPARGKSNRLLRCRVHKTERTTQEHKRAHGSIQARLNVSLPCQFCVRSTGGVLRALNRISHTMKNSRFHERAWWAGAKCEWYYFEQIWNNYRLHFKHDKHISLSLLYCPGAACDSRFINYACGIVN